MIKQQIFKLNRFLTPPVSWRVPVTILCGIIAGFGIYIAYIANIGSYLSDNPKTCVNCHIMAPQFATWSHSAHREVATCNDCHVPHNNVFNKYFFKAKDGLRHAFVFTMRSEPQAIQIKAASLEAVYSNCVRCHQTVIRNDEISLHTGKPCVIIDPERKCWDCHRETPHGRVNSLSSVPFARVPLPESPVPEWLQNFIKTK